MMSSSPLASPASPEDAAASASATDGIPVVADAQVKQQPKVQVDMSHIIVGRIKEAPVCVDAGLKQEAMSADELSQFAFGASCKSMPVVTPTTSTNIVYEPSTVSSSSSTASRESSDFSDVEGITIGFLPSTNKSASEVLTTSQSSSFSSWTVVNRKEESERINYKVTTQKISRNGRQTQRWYTDPATQRLYRLTTGCVPVVEGGKILFVSSSRKPEWILPKGGWEMDEAMEESAIRETFEEAGVLGILGPVLGEIEYETRKAKKRRLEFEEVQRKALKVREAHSPNPTKVGEAKPATQAAETSSLPQVEGNKPVNDGDTCSVASDHSQNYTHVKMKLFPLYVTEVRKSWPEEGRFRKAVPIDEAIRMTQNRPEFHAALKELKERNLHLPQVLPSAPRIQEPSAAVATPVSAEER